MKYSVEIENGIARETLVFNSKEYVRTTEKTDFGFGSNSKDEIFSEQMKNEGLSISVLNQIYDILDGSLVDSLLTIAESEE